MALPGEVKDLQALKTENVSFSSDGARIEAYLAQPRAGGRRPGIIVIHEAFGPVEHIFDLARRFASIGYNALAPNLYSRVGTPKPGDMQDLFGKMLGLEDRQTVRDLEAAAAHLRALPGATGKVGAIGFCSGGRQTLLYATSSARVDAAVDCWGGFIDAAGPNQETTPARPRKVIDLAADLRCPLYAVFGQEDQNPSPAVAAELERRLRAGGKTFQVEVFANAGHAFLADYRDSYREAAAFALWPKVLQFFESHLK